MNNQRNQPIYDNKKLKNAGKYNFENVNSINKRNGEMIFDSTMYNNENKKTNKTLIITIIASITLILFSCIFAFTDVKKIFIKDNPKEETIVKDFEEANVMHRLVCKQSYKRDGMIMNTTKTFIYNNNKIKATKYEYMINVTKEDIYNDNTYHEFMISSFNEIIDKFSGQDGIKLNYSRNDSEYYFVQEIDLYKISSHENYRNLTDVYLDDNIDTTSSKLKRQSFKCEVEV